MIEAAPEEQGHSKENRSDKDDGKEAALTTPSRDAHGDDVDHEQCHPDPNKLDRRFEQPRPIPLSENAGPRLDVATNRKQNIKRHRNQRKQNKPETHGERNLPPIGESRRRRVNSEPADG